MLGEDMLLWIVLILLAVFLSKKIVNMNKEARVNRNSPVERILRERGE